MENTPDAGPVLLIPAVCATVLVYLGGQIEAIINYLLKEAALEVGG